MLRINIPRFIQRTAVFAAIMLAAPTAIAVCQDDRGAADPTEIVQQFKSDIDANDVTAMCTLMTESDHSAPLSRLHFESMQSSMNELVKLWQYTSFTYGQMTTDNSKKPLQATVWVAAGQLRQDVKFTLLKFPAGWFIADIEIYFK